jgi:peptidyl-dipeptidase Dcp
LFHEFGHALHDLLQDVRYPGLAWTPADFVEFPSQVNEEWMLTDEVLDKFARHYQTGERLPAALAEKIHRLAKVQPGIRDGGVPLGRDPRHGAAHAC